MTTYPRWVTWPIARRFRGFYSSKAHLLLGPVEAGCAHAEGKGRAAELGFVQLFAEVREGPCGECRKTAEAFGIPVPEAPCMS